MRAAKLKEVIERHLPYEIAGLFRFFQIFTDGVPVSGLPGQLIHTALGEAFCIHTRVLHDFLTNRPGTGVHAKHATHGYKPFANGGIDRKITNKLHDHVASHLKEPSSLRSTSVPKSVVAKSLAEELMVFRERLRFAKTTDISVTHDGGYHLTRPGRTPVVIHPK